ncbi:MULTISPECIES: pyridoxal phosphate-dependent aminotransferase [Chitinophaga]|uniref:pyridoxal phosphate-dependent aminotransferase n=1 Tax=Chitinophaga TaxID=79328 RepID=UPI000DBAB1C4|nr:pyridoxal phosphate-dependent aminotransferase [Chitinophaga ginsengisegetis]MDR6569357.1 aspartate aminotransferase [Chitinophaga ginsengisegetis]MDR6648612.1 aspartate aminotransferase [Chitinophaga ginsengisegetis]MDR6655440.1 aspartate aminotransferase [Chitinophaga ginsengisegetis]
MNQLADRLSRISEPQTIKMAKLGRELKAQGIDIVDLSIGEPDFDTPAHIREAAKKAIDEGFTHYTPVAGYPDVRQAVVHKLKRDNGLDYTPEQIVVSTGAKQCLANAVLSIVNPGDEVIIPTPYWVTYSEQVSLCQGEVVFVPCSIENNYKITPEQLEAAITPKTKLFMFSSPCNPTGSVYSKKELEGLAAVFAKHPEIFIISDEIYEYINYEGKHESIAQFGDLINRTIIINGLSKGFAMTGWRLGYLAAPLDIAKACDKIQSQFTSATCSITQRAAITALTGELTTAVEMVAEFKKRRDYIHEALKTIPGLKVNDPEGAFYMFPDVSAFFNKSFEDSHIKNADDLCMYLLHKAHVSTVTGSAFQQPNCIRLSYATSMDKLEKGVERMKTWLGKLA